MNSWKRGKWYDPGNYRRRFSVSAASDSRDNKQIQINMAPALFRGLFLMEDLKMELKVKERDIRRFYCELVELLTNYENDEYTDEADLYTFLVDLQTKMDFIEWEE